MEIENNREASPHVTSVATCSNRPQIAGKNTVE
jgi:hypothetical protein